MVKREGSKSIGISGETYSFDQAIANVIEYDGFIIVHLDTDDYEVGDPMVGRNVLGFNQNGELVWRVEDHGFTIGPDDVNRVPQSFMTVWVGPETGKLKAALPYLEFTLDAKTGLLSDTKPNR